VIILKENMSTTTSIPTPSQLSKSSFDEVLDKAISMDLSEFPPPVKELDGFKSAIPELLPVMKEGYDDYLLRIKAGFPSRYSHQKMVKLKEEGKL
jgi:hypothetical protein